MTTAQNIRPSSPRAKSEEAGGGQHQQDATASAVAIVDSDESYSNGMHV